VNLLEDETSREFEAVSGDDRESREMTNDEKIQAISSMFRRLFLAMQEKSADVPQSVVGRINPHIHESLASPIERVRNLFMGVVGDILVSNEAYGALRDYEKGRSRLKGYFNNIGNKKD